MVFFGIVIGVILIVVDTKVNSRGSRTKADSKSYNGFVKENADAMYFTTAEFSETSYEFGKVKEGDTVMHKFVLKNTGDEPLMIYKSRGSCDCIKAYYSEKPILPGAAADIKVYFKTIGRKGRQVRSVSINTNTDPSEATLTLTGEVE
jgi:hypothetical protein